MSIAAATSEVRQAMADLESKYFRLQRLVAASIGSPIYPEVKIACEEVANVYRFTALELVGRTKTGALAWARQVAMTLCHSCRRMTLHEIGGAFERDHGTVLHSVRRVTNEVETNSPRGREFLQIQSSFQARIKVMNIDLLTNCQHSEPTSYTTPSQ